MRQKAVLAERDSSLGSKAEKEGICPVEARSGNIGKTQSCCFPLQGENSCYQSSAAVQGDRIVGDNKRVFFKYIDDNKQCKNNICSVQDVDGHLTNGHGQGRDVKHILCLCLQYRWQTTGVCCKTMTARIITPSWPWNGVGSVVLAGSLQIYETW